MGRVSFIPAQIDGLAASTSRQSRDSPLFVMYHDIQTLARNALYLPLMMMPLNTMDPKAETYPNSSNLRDMSIHLALIVLETTFLVLAVPAFLVLPGIVSTMIATTTACVIGIMCLPMMGPRHMRSNTSNGMSEQYRHVSDERWIFMNGCMTSSNSLQAQIDRLSQTFGRPILGIHNRSYGLIADLLECFLQRAFNMTTTSSRATYEHLKAYVLDPTITKVVCIAHSQGALSLSIVLDRMLAELPTDVMAKLEIYTFGSAAAHFNNPLQTFRTKGSASGFGQGVQDGEGGRRHIPYIEHYTNQYDMLARFGVLNSMMQTPEQTHCGRVFMRASAAGSLMNQHYMNTMFPLSRMANTRLFLDEVVDVDEATAMRRESIIEPPQDVGDDMGLKSIMTTPRKNNDANGMKINFLDVAKAAVEDAKGKTVRDLSRLWRYQGGAKVAPLEAGFGAALMNGIVNPLKNVREREGK